MKRSPLDKSTNKYASLKPVEVKTQKQLDTIKKVLQNDVNTTPKPAKFKLGEPVLVAYTFGDYIDNKSRYGKILFAVIHNIEYVQTRDAYLYTMVYRDDYTISPMYLIRGEGWIFKIDDVEGCKKCLQQETTDKSFMR